jgi:phage terminase large subunit-like protein
MRSTVTTRGTARSTLRLSEVARHVVIPSGIATTAWDRVEAWWSVRGIRFDGWQQGVGQVALGKRADGKYAATVGGVVLSIPRQVGKTFLVGAVIVALCCLYPGLTVVWTAHRTRTATKTFQTLQAMVKRKGVAGQLAPNGIRTANGEQEIKFANGSIIMFGAREQGFGRGFDEVDVEVFDEAQILTEKALEDMVPAMNQSRHPAGGLLFFMGTPPRPNDPGEVFTLKRQRALDGKSKDIVYVECSADADADPDDMRQVEKANPSYPDRTPREAIERMRENLPSVESFLREGLGIWSAVTQSGVIPMSSWSDREDRRSVAVQRFGVGVEVAPDMEWASVVVAGQRADGAWHIVLAERRRGADWAAPYVRRLVDLNPGIRGVAVDEKSPTTLVTDELRENGIRWMAPKPDELGQAHSRMLEGLVTGQVFHIGQVQMTIAASVAGKRKLADTGLWVFARTSATAEITPIQGAVLALWVAQHDKPRRPLRRAGGRRVVTF